MTQENTIGWNFSSSYLSLPDHFYAYTNPTPVQNPDWVIINEQLAEDLDLDVKLLTSREGLAILSGNRIPPDSKPIAQAYAGHQFGYFTMLGDGRAILLGEHQLKNGDHVDIQLKGAGKTPYSRGGDGRASLAPMLREFLISEAMHGLGISTTRALAVVLTGEDVYREQALPGAILTRVASSHLRVGTFQYARKYGTEANLKRLADYAIARHFPQLEEKSNCYLAFLKEVVERQASLIAKWDLVGFVHGVMNTDNMTIGGETIDYGPCAFIDRYEPATVFSSIDQHGRYAFNQQKPVAVWNLARLAEALLPILADEPKDAIHGAESLLNYFTEVYEEEWLTGMKAKLGFFAETDIHRSLIDQLLVLMKKFQADYTDTFRALTIGDFSKQNWFKSVEFQAWHKRWKGKLNDQSNSEEDIIALMKHSNPAIIPRNFQVEAVLKKAVNDRDYQPFKQFYQVLKDPYAYSEQQLSYTELPPNSDQPYQTFCGT
ncbi:MAG TPA: YdiU family protein [Bacilli bacterium]|nr:YdiU family protein [Bacilli bacterium]